jgi:hypothetical protein
MVVTLRQTLLFLSVLVGAAGLCACGGPVGDSHEGILESGDQVMEDNSYFDLYRFDAKQGWQIQIEMTSTDFDAYLLLSDPNASKIGENDDAEGTDAAISMEAPIDGTYEVYANSKNSGMTGAYSLRIRATPPGGGS